MSEPRIRWSKYPSLARPRTTRHQGSTEILGEGPHEFAIEPNFDSPRRYDTRRMKPGDDGKVQKGYRLVSGDLFPITTGPLVTSTGKPRERPEPVKRYFDTLREAKAFCEQQLRQYEATVPPPRDA